MPYLGFEVWPSAVEIDHVTITPLHHGKCLTNKHIFVSCKINVRNTIKSNFPATHPKSRAEMYDSNMPASFPSTNAAAADTTTAPRPRTQQKTIQYQTITGSVGQRHVTNVTGSFPLKQDSEVSPRALEIS